MHPAISAFTRALSRTHTIWHHPHHAASPTPCGLHTMRHVAWSYLAGTRLWNALHRGGHLKSRFKHLMRVFQAPSTQLRHLHLSSTSYIATKPNPNPLCCSLSKMISFGSSTLTFLLSSHRVPVLQDTYCETISWQVHRGRALRLGLGLGLG